MRDSEISNVVKVYPPGDTTGRCAQVWAVESARTVTDAADCAT